MNLNLFANSRREDAQKAKYELRTCKIQCRLECTAKGILLPTKQNMRISTALAQFPGMLFSNL